MRTIAISYPLVSGSAYVACMRQLRKFQTADLTIQLIAVLLFARAALYAAEVLAG